MIAFKIQKVSTDDIDQLQEIGTQTFLEAFADQNTKEDMDMYLSEKFSKSNVEKEVKSNDSYFYFAKNNVDDVIGYLKVNVGDSQTEMADLNSIEIERIYVLKEYYGKGVGQVLFEKALQIAKGLNTEYIWLGVWEKNPRAIRFYEKNGFVAFDKHQFLLGTDKQIDIMMKLSLLYSN